MTFRSPNDSRGFTLVELMVSVSIYIIVMVVATGALISIVGNDRKAQAQQTSFTNLDFALESMSRAIRIGSSFRCIPGNFSTSNIGSPQDCGSGGPSFAFEPFGGSSSTNNDQWAYRLNGTTVERSIDGGATFVPVTSSDVVVQGLTFYVRGSAPGDGVQPAVLISIWGYAGSSTNKTLVNFNLQTVATERLLDL